MGLFDSVDVTVSSPTDYSSFEPAGVDVPFSWDIPLSSDLLPTPSSLFPFPSSQPDGVQLINSRSNTSFWDFDQSQIPQSLQNVFGSLTEAAAKTGLQVAQSSMNKGTQQPGNIGGFFRNFQSTQTGAQINAGAYATQFQNFLYNPMVWFAAIAGIVLLFVMKRV
jgi:hypothetical protein